MTAYTKSLPILDIKKKKDGSADFFRKPVSDEASRVPHAYLSIEKSEILYAVKW